MRRAVLPRGARQPSDRQPRRAGTLLAHCHGERVRLVLVIRGAPY